MLHDRCRQLLHRCFVIQQGDQVQHNELSGALQPGLFEPCPYDTSGGASIPRTADERDRNRTAERFVQRFHREAIHVQCGEILTPVL